MTMQMQLFNEAEARVKWDQFFFRVTTICRPLSENHRQEIVFEIKDHLYESFKHQPGNSEVQKLESAIEKFGIPEDIVRPMVADHQLETAGRTMNPRSVFLGLFFNMSRGVRAVLTSLLFGIGYLVSLIFLLVAIGKPFNPDGIGLFALSGGGYALGLYDQQPAGATELLGYWIIPLGISVAVAGYWVLTRLVSRKRKQSTGSG
jgi:hypothetical protein